MKNKLTERELELLLKALGQSSPAFGASAQEWRALIDKLTKWKGK